MGPRRAIPIIPLVYICVCTNRFRQQAPEKVYDQPSSSNFPRIRFPGHFFSCNSSRVAQNPLSHFAIYTDAEAIVE